MSKFRCKTCMYIHEGDDAPSVCPKCGAPKEQFERIPENMAALIDRSKVTNFLLIESLKYLEELEKLSIKGINDNLDPSCLYIFRHINEFVTVLKAMIYAEINTHTEKGKWG